jgi:hypothetical protein
MAQASSGDRDPRVALGAAILAASGMNPSSLKGPLFPQFYDPIEHQKEFENRRRVMYESDKRMCRDILDTVFSSDEPREIAVIVPERSMIQTIIHEIAHPRITRIQEYRLMVDGHTNVYFRTGREVLQQGGVHGRHFDAILLHDDLSWRVYVALLPSLKSL